MSEDLQHAPIPPPRKPPLGLMGWIAGYKLFKAAATLFFAVESLFYRRRDLEPLFLWWVARLDLDPHGKIVSSLGIRLTHLTSAHFNWVRAALFFYFVLFATEGIGLLLEKTWAEWLTILATAVLLPPAIYEMMHHPTLLKFVFVQFNLGVIAYLQWRLRRDAAMERQAQIGKAA